MNAQRDSMLDGIVTAVGLLLLVLGTATGNAYFVFSAPIAAIVVVAMFGRRSFSWSVLFGMSVAAVMVFIVAFGLTKLWR